MDNIDINITESPIVVSVDATETPDLVTVEILQFESGIPRGGTVGQVLTKVDGTDYNTSWQDAAGDDRAFAVAMAVALG